MFTGIIEDIGRILGKSASALDIECGLPGLAPGASVAVNGACLTVARRRKRAARFEVSQETWRRTNLGGLKIGGAVNLERAVKAGKELGGHLVTGHVDARGKVISLKRQNRGFAVLRVELPQPLWGLAAAKGSIAVDGASLTIAAMGRGWFEAALVPFTLSHTTLGRRKPGDAVNLEADLIARYVRAALKFARL